MIEVLSSRQLFIFIAFGVAALFELGCAVIILKRDKNFAANRFTSIAYLSLSISLFLSIFYVLITDSNTISFLHRIANIMNLITVIFLFLAAMIISEGPNSLKSYRVTLVGVDTLFGILLLVIPGVTIIQYSSSESLIAWNNLFLLTVLFPLYTTLIWCCYYYLKVWRGITAPLISRACLYITLGTSIFGLSHFLVVFPLWMRTLDESFNAQIFTLIGSVGVLIASLLITLGYNTRISRSKTVVSLN